MQNKLQGMVNAAKTLTRDAEDAVRLAQEQQAQTCTVETIGTDVSNSRELRLAQEGLLKARFALGRMR